MKGMKTLLSSFCAMACLAPAANAEQISQLALLKPSNTGVSSGFLADAFGTSVAIYDDTMVVGAPGEDGGGTGTNPPSDETKPDSGAAYVFVWNGSSWIQSAYLKASNSGAGDAFGTSVAIDGDTIVIGAPSEQGSGFGVDPPEDDLYTRAGAAYVFQRDGASWNQTAYLKSNQTDFGEDEFGASVAVFGEYVVVGAPRALDKGGRAVMFRNPGAGWQLEQILTPLNPGPGDDGEDGDIFGCSVAIAENPVHGLVIAVGARFEDGSGTAVNAPDDDEGTSRGAAYLFRKSSGTWTQQAYLKSPNGGTGGSFGQGQFGASVALSGDLLVVGEPLESGMGSGVNPPFAEGVPSFGSGAAHVFEFDSTLGIPQWVHRAYLKPHFPPGSLDRFGESVAVSGEVVAVGSPFEDGRAGGINPPHDNLRSDAGAVCTYRRTGAVWTSGEVIKPSAPANGNQFGASVGLAGDFIVSGTPGESSFQGGVFVFSVEDDPIRITAVSRTATQMTIDFTTAPGLTGFTTRGSANLAGFPGNHTAATVFTELSPGRYRAVVDLTGLPGDRYFFRIER